MQVNVSIIYHSATGNVHALAEAAAEAPRETPEATLDDVPTELEAGRA